MSGQNVVDGTCLTGVVGEVSQAVGDVGVASEAISGQSESRKTSDADVVDDCQAVRKAIASVCQIVVYETDVASDTNSSVLNLTVGNGRDC